METYLKIVETHPLKTKMIVGGFLNAFSDILAQSLMGRKRIDTTSTKHQAILGLLFRAPVMHFWFKGLDKVFVNMDPKSVKTVILKVLCEQLIVAPIFCALNVILTGIMENKPADEIKRILRENFLMMWKNNIKVWSLVGAFQYRFVPEYLRVFVGNLVSIFWNAYIISVSRGQVTSSKNIILTE